MNNFMTDLIVYYACAIAAEHNVLPSGEAMRCALAYERAKVHFYSAPAAPPGSRARARQSSTAFAAFRAWEKANPGEVADLKALARDIAGPGPAT